MKVRVSFELRVAGEEVPAKQREALYWQIADALADVFAQVRTMPEGGIRMEWEEDRTEGR